MQESLKQGVQARLEASESNGDELQMEHRAAQEKLKKCAKALYYSQQNLAAVHKGAAEIQYIAQQLQDKTSTLAIEENIE